MPVRKFIFSSKNFLLISAANIISIGMFGIVGAAM